MRGPGLHRDGSIQIELSKHGPETVVSHVRERSASKLIPAAKHAVRIVRMIRPIERRPEPKGPIEAVRDRRFVRGNGWILRPHRPVRPVVHLAQRANGAVVDPRLDGTNTGSVAGW